MNYTVHENLARLFSLARQHLDPADLESMTSLSELASDEARHLSKVAEAIGCLVSSDEDQNGFADRGSVATLLFHIAHCTDVIAGLAHVGDEALFERKQRQLRELQEVKP